MPVRLLTRAVLRDASTPTSSRVLRYEIKFASKLENHAATFERRMCFIAVVAGGISARRWRQHSRFRRFSGAQRTGIGDGRTRGIRRSERLPHRVLARISRCRRQDGTCRASRFFSRESRSRLRIEKRNRAVSTRNQNDGSATARIDHNITARVSRKKNQPLRSCDKRGEKISRARRTVP